MLKSVSSLVGSISISAVLAAVMAEFNSSIASCTFVAVSPEVLLLYGLEIALVSTKTIGVPPLEKEYVPSPLSIKLDFKIFTAVPDSLV